MTKRKLPKVALDPFDELLGVSGTEALAGPGSSTAAVKVTPEMATAWVTHRNEKNRPIRAHTVDRYATDLQRGKWKTTHQGIAFGPDGELIDGQHRLAAIVKAGLPATLFVTIYLTPEDAAEAKLKCDTGRVKSTGDVFAMVGLTGRFQGDRLAAVVKGMRLLEGQRGDSLSPDEIQAAYLTDRTSVDWAMAALDAPGFTALHRSAFAYAHSVFPDEIDAFASMIKNMDAPLGSPANIYVKADRVGQFRASAGYGRREVSLKILRLLKAHVSGEDGPSKLYATTEALEFFRTRREQMALEAATPKHTKAQRKKATAPRPKADVIYDALTHNGYKPAQAKRALKALGDRLETDAIEALTRDAFAFLAAG